MFNVATIGTSFITDEFLKALAQVEDIRCTAMYTRAQAHAQTLA